MAHSVRQGPVVQSCIWMHNTKVSELQEFTCYEGMLLAEENDTALCREASLMGMISLCEL